MRCSRTGWRGMCGKDSVGEADGRAAWQTEVYFSGADGTAKYGQTFAGFALSALVVFGHPPFARRG